MAAAYPCYLVRFDHVLGRVQKLPTTLRRALLPGLDGSEYLWWNYLCARFVVVSHSLAVVKAAATVRDNCLT
jgi:hypothetical protein